MKLYRKHNTPARPFGSGGRVRRGLAGFTMVEIAICLAIIGVALVAIIGVLPREMDVQRKNREETIINQDASVILEDIRRGVHSGTDLTNYIFGITNYSTVWVASGNVYVPGPTTVVDGYGYAGSSLNGASSPFALTNNANIIGLLSTPEFFLNNNQAINFGGGTSNHVVAYVHSLSGPAVEKPPQDNSILIGDSFSYRVLCVNAPPAMDINSVGQAYGQRLAANVHELSLTFDWPLLPSGTAGHIGPLIQRIVVPGALLPSNFNGQDLYFYQFQSFTNQP